MAEKKSSSTLMNETMEKVNDESWISATTKCYDIYVEKTENQRQKRKKRDNVTM